MGRCAARALSDPRALKDAVGDRIWFAGEALSRLQWGTVGGAWGEGERAAQDIANRLRLEPSPSAERR